VARAKLGDKSAKEKLQKLFHVRLNDKDENIDDPNQPSKRRKVKTGNMLGALACVSEPNEAVRYFLNYMKTQTVSELIEDYCFFDNIQLLPTAQARQVIRTYLEKLSKYQPPTRQTFSGKVYKDWEQTLNPLREVIGLYGNRQIAENIFKIQLLIDEDEDHIIIMDISQYFTAESIPLLKKGLLSKNNKLKAWCVWQLRKLNYDWKKEELDKLLEDENWYVRTNAELIKSIQSTMK